MFRYLAGCRRVVLLLLLFVVIFMLVFRLYDLEIEAILYASLLCCLAGILFIVVGFLRELKRHREREMILNNIALMPSRLPVADSMAEADYQRMALALWRLNQDMLTDYAQERTQSLDYFTTWVHQIKTPIAAMQMMLQQEDTQEHRDLAIELFRVEQYAQMALSFLRLGKDASDFVFKPYQLDPIIREAVRMFAPQFVKKRIRLIYEPVSLMVLTDEKWLSLIIEQMLSNAIKYTNQGSVTISVTPDKLLRIRDTGIGIAKEDLPRIFEKGFTGYNGRENTKSTGLGLYLAKSAADKLSYKLGVTSSPGEGSEFTVDLNREELEIE